MMFGLKNRTTQDIDLSYSGKCTLDELKIFLDDLSAIAKEDNVQMDVLSIKERPIIVNLLDKRKTKFYAKCKICFTTFSGNNNRKSVKCRKDTIELDIASSEDIVCKEQNFESFVSTEKFVIQAYTVETILAEKIHATYSIFESNDRPTRARDWFDIGYFNLYKKDLFEYNTLLESINKTFSWRGVAFDINQFKKSIEYIIENNGKDQYDKLAFRVNTDISFETIID